MAGRAIWHARRQVTKNLLKFASQFAQTAF
jgi:hypothetical protein